MAKRETTEYMDWTKRLGRMDHSIFSCGGNVKQKFYRQNIKNLDHLRELITVNSIISDVLRPVFPETFMRFKLIIDNKGRNIEQVI